MFERKFTTAERNKLRYQKEKVEDLETGELIDAVRVFKEEGGIWDFDHCTDNRVKHNKIINDGQLKVSKDELPENF